MPIERPPGMPRNEKFDRCWGRLIQDGDRECEQCRWNDSCRSKFLEAAVTAPQRTTPVQPLPIYGQQRAQAPAGIVPLPPPRPMSPPVFQPNPPIYPPPPQAYQQAPQVPVQVRYATPSAPTPPPPPAPAPVPQYQAYQHPPQPQPYQYQQPQGYWIPDPSRPNPMHPMYRPGAPGPAYYFNQYPEESVGARLTKNMFLRAMEALFKELASFFGNWTMPPRQ